MIGKSTIEHVDWKLFDDLDGKNLWCNKNDIVFKSFLFDEERIRQKHANHNKSTSSSTSHYCIVPAGSAGLRLSAVLLGLKSQSPEAFGGVSSPRVPESSPPAQLQDLGIYYLDEPDTPLLLQLQLRTLLLEIRITQS